MTNERITDPIHDSRINAVLRRMEVQEEDRWRQRVEREGEGDGGRGAWAYPENGFPINADQGELLYVVGRAIGARRVVEFATSLGFSTIYLAAAVRDNGGGIVIGSELLPEKVQEAKTNLTEAGLTEFVEIREGDALETFRDLEGPIDIALLDGWPTGELPSLDMRVFKLIEPHLRPGSIVLVDNNDPDLLGHLRDPANGYHSMALPLHHGTTELAVRT